MNKNGFVYTTYIRTTPEKLWDALTKPEFTRQYWSEVWHETTWKPGAEWKMKIPDGRTTDAGEVVEADKPRRLVLRWRNEFRPELKADEQQGDMVKLTIVHELEKDVAKSKFIEAVSSGWPIILSSLKSLLETGESLEATRKWPKGM
jgi:uncharacterized protein YndB with AHSA1/START domain